MGLNPISTVLDIGEGLIKHFFPDPKDQDVARLKLLELQQTGALAELTATTDLAKAQDAINQQEAANSSLFVAGWRPFIGWACGCAFAYSFVLQPFTNFILACLHISVDPKSLPQLDIGGFMPVLLGMLGLGAMRTYEKVQGIQAGH